jgi:ATP-dependent Clp protease ATP-binding subunit ClpA
MSDDSSSASWWSALPPFLFPGGRIPADDDFPPPQVLPVLYHALLLFSLSAVRWAYADADDSEARANERWNECLEDFSPESALAFLRSFLPRLFRDRSDTSVGGWSRWFAHEPRRDRLAGLLLDGFSGEVPTAAWDKVPPSVREFAVAEFGAWRHHVVLSLDGTGLGAEEPARITDIFPSVEEPFTHSLSLPPAGGLPPGATYLFGPKSGLLPLSPFFRLETCPECGDDHLFMLEHMEHGRLRYRDPSFGHTLVLLVPELFFSEGEFFLEKGAWSTAEKWLLRAREHQLNPSEVRRRLVRCYRGLAEEAIQAGDVRLAVKHLERGLEHYPENPTLSLIVGQCLFKLGEYRGCVRRLKPLVDRPGLPGRILELMARSYEQIEQFSEAAAFYRRAAAREPERISLRDGYLRMRKREREQTTPATPPAATTGSEEKRFKFEDYVIDLNDYVLARALPPLPARDGELSTLAEILCCLRKRNALVTGEPGVGKSALILELARRIMAEEVAPDLLDKRIYQLNVAALVAGARFRGQYEERLLDLVAALRGKAEAILYIDDIHTFFNSSSNRSGNLDASHVFKPALALGEIQMIGVTSNEHYRLNLVSDPAIQRSFQLVRLNEPDDEQARLMLAVAVRDLENYHDVAIPTEAVNTALELSKVFIRDRALPDKAIGLLDHACVLARENPADTSGAPRAGVGRGEIVQAVAKRTSVPAEKIAAHAALRFLQLETVLKEQIIGQDKALETVGRVLRVSRMKLQLKPERPDGVFLFAGPTGVGKTELALALTEFLFGDREKMLRIDMSEFMEHISTSKLIGIAPGYVGYNDKNQLTDKVRQEPYCLVLLDEIEKASPQVLNLFLQVFDTGRLTDSKGNTVYFDHTVFVLTSNLGTELYGRSQVGYGSGRKRMPAEVSRVEMMRAIKSYLPPEFINRLDALVFFNPLGEEEMAAILDLHVNAVKERVWREYRVALELDETARQTLLERGFDPEFGARELHRTLRRLLLDPLAGFLIRSGEQKMERILVRGRKLTHAAEESLDVELTHEEEILSFVYAE